MAYLYNAHLKGRMHDLKAIPIDRRKIMQRITKTINRLSLRITLPCSFVFLKYFWMSNDDSAWLRCFELVRRIIIILNTVFLASILAHRKITSDKYIHAKFIHKNFNCKDNLTVRRCACIPNVWDIIILLELTASYCYAIYKIIMPYGNKWNRACK
jgi:hypothetical protein